MLHQLHSRERHFRVRIAFSLAIGERSIFSVFVSGPLMQQRKGPWRNCCRFSQVKDTCLQIFSDPSQKKAAHGCWLVMLIAFLLLFWLPWIWDSCFSVGSVLPSLFLLGFLRTLGSHHPVAPWAPDRWAASDGGCLDSFTCSFVTWQAMSSHGTLRTLSKDINAWHSTEFKLIQIGHQFLWNFLWPCASSFGVWSFKDTYACFCKMALTHSPTADPVYDLSCIQFNPICCDMLWP